MNNTKRLFTILMVLALLCFAATVWILPVGAQAEEKALSSNLLNNGSFTYSTTGWNLSNATASWQKTVAYSGYALKITAASGNYIYANDFSVTAGATYVLSYWVRVDSASGLSFSTFLNDHNSNKSWWKDYVTATVTAVTDGWVQIIGAVTIPESVGNNTVQLGFKVYGGSGTLYLDEVSVKELEVSDSPNLDFETLASTGAPADWYLSSVHSHESWADADATVYRSGKTSLHIYKDSLQEKSLIESPVFVPVSGGKIYEFSFWMASRDASPTTTVRMNLIPYDETGMPLYTDGTQQVIYGTTAALNSTEDRNGWTKVVTRSAMPENAAYVSVRFELTRGTVELWLDDLCIDVVEDGTDCVVYYEDFHAVDQSGNVSNWKTENATLSGGKLTSKGAGYMYTPIDGLQTGYSYCLKGTCSVGVSGKIMLRFYDYMHQQYTQEEVSLLQGQTTISFNFTAPSCTFTELWIGSENAGTITLTELTLYKTADAPQPENSTTDPSWSEKADRDNVVSSVEIYNGTPTLIIDGEPTAAYFYQRPDLDAYLQTDAESRIAQSGLELYITYGGNLYKGGCDPIWLEDGSIDYDAFDAVIYDTLAASENALVMVNIGMFAPAWWLEQNPDHEAMASDGTNLITLGDVSLASEKFREEAGEVLRKLITHMKQQNYYNRVFGLKISGGQSYEWMTLGTGDGKGPDYSPVSQEGFKAYLKEKYGTEAALQAAWGDDSVTFDTAAAPTWTERTDFTNVYMGDGDTGALSRNMVDWNLWLNEASADSFLYYCQIAKEETDGQIIVGGYNGYLWTSNTYDSQGKAHTAMDRVLDSEYVDWIASPVAYNERLLGESDTYMALLDSVQEHGKLYIAEQDNRTCLAEGYTGVSWDAQWDFQVGQTHTMADTIYQQKRDFANALVNGAGLWQYDMYGGWLDDQQLYEYIQDAKAEYDLSVYLDRDQRNEVAVFVGDETYAYLTAGSANMPYTLLEPMLMQQRKHLSVMGAGYDTYAMSSLLEGKVSDHKLNIVLSPFEITEEMQTAIDQYLKKDGQVVVWVYLPGISTGTSLDISNVERATGFSIGVVEEKSTLQVQLVDAGHSLTDGIADLIYGSSASDATSPLTYIADTTGATVLGYNLDGDQMPGLAVKDMGDWISVYSSAPCLDVALLRNLMDLAGCHSYSQSNEDVIYSNNHYVALHSATAEEKTITLPGNFAVYDVFKQKYISMNTDTITYDHDAKDTRIFRLTEPETYTVSVRKNANGTVSQEGISFVTPGSSYSLTVTPDAGFVVERVTVNGVLQEVSSTGGTLELIIQENTVIQVRFDRWALIENGDLESGSFTGDVSASGASVVSDERVYTGRYSLNLNQSDGVRDLVKITVYPTVSSADRTITVSFRARLKDTASAGPLRTAKYCFEGDWTNTGSVYSKFTPTQTWEKFTETMTLPAGSSVFQYLLYTSADSTDIYIDDISISINGQEMMINGGLERGNFGGSFTEFENTPTVVEESIAHEGSYAALFASGDTVTATAEDLNLTEATAMELSLWMRVPADGAEAATYTVTALSEAGVELSSFSGSFAAAADDAWYEQTKQFGVPAGTDSVQIQVTAQGTLYLDDLSLSVVKTDTVALSFWEIYTDGTWRLKAEDMSLLKSKYYKIPAVLDGQSGYVIGSVMTDMICIYPSFFGVYGGSVPVVSFVVPENAMLIPISPDLHWGEIGGGIPLQNTQQVAVTLKQAEMKTWNVALGGDLKVNFYADIQADELSAVQTVITVAGVSETYKASQYDEAQQAYVFSTHIAAAQMTDEICVQIMCGDAVLLEKTYTVLEYARYLLESEEYSSYHQLVKEMLNYGGAAQTYFAYNTQAPVNEGLTGVGAQDIPTEAESQMECTGRVDGLAFYGASVLFRNQLGVRFYFTTEDAKGYTFTVNGITYTPTEKDGMFYVEVPDINPQDLDAVLTLTATDGTNSLSVTYSPMDYIVRMGQKGSQSLQELLKALYNYHLAAKALQ